jgi:autotransporter-associated beta strand protein
VGNSNLGGIWGGGGTQDLGIRELSTGGAWLYGSGNGSDFVGPASFNGGTMAINGAQVATGANGAYTLGTPQVLMASNINLGGFAVTGLGQYFNTAGSAGAPSRFFIGDVGEVLVYNPGLDTGSIQQVTSYLLNKWLGTQPSAYNTLPVTTTVNISNGGTFDMTNGTQTIASLSSTDGNGSKVLLGNGVLTVGDATTTTFDGAISGAGGSLVMQGPGKLVLNGANTYNGGTTISGGTLQFGDGAVKNGAVQGNIVNNSSLVFANPLNQTYGGVVSGNGSLTKNGAGVLVLTANQTYSGPTLVSGGTLQLAPTSGSLSGFGGNGAGWTLNGGPTVSNNVLTLTDGNRTEARSAFLNTPVPVNVPFVTSFTFASSAGVNSLNGFLADGVCFVLQNDNRGPNALGGQGGQLGYGILTPITPSAAIELNTYSYVPDSGGAGTAFETNGTVPKFSGGGTAHLVSALGIAGTFQVTLSYDGSSTLTESVSGSTTFSYSYSVGSLATIVGSNAAYIGFTGGTGDSDATFAISNLVSTIGAGSNILPSTTALTISSSAALDLFKSSQTVGSLSGAGVLTTSDTSKSTLTVSGTDSTTFSGSINDGAGHVALALTSGTLTLSGTNTYTGGTTVNGGTLIVTSAAGLADGSNLSVGDPLLLQLLPASAVPSPVAAAAVVQPVPEAGSLAILLLGGGLSVRFVTRGAAGGTRRRSAPDRPADNLFSWRSREVTGESRTVPFVSFNRYPVCAGHAGRCGLSWR